VSDPAPPGPQRLWRFFFVALIVLGAAVGGGWVIGAKRPLLTGPLPSPILTSVPVTFGPDRRGELLFQVHCAVCHGPEGRGDGVSSATLRPRPRDFAARPWRFEVTPESIRRVILDGIPGTAMVSFRSALAPADVHSLVGYTHHLASSRPTVVYELSEEEKLLKGAGFIDLRGTTPPALTVTDADGKDVKLTDLKGRMVLIHFWGTSCSHCLKEMPRLKELETAWARRGFTVLHVCTDTEDIKEAQEIATRSDTGLRVFGDASGLGLARFEVRVLPTLWLIGPDGNSIGRSHGIKDWSAPAFRQLVEHWLPTGPGDR